MDYTVTELKEKIIAGISARTNNTSPDMPMVIGGLWQSFYGDGICGQIPQRANEKALGIYSDYASDAMGDYTVTAGCEVLKKGNLPDKAEYLTIPAGKYAKFIIRGHMQKAVSDFWQELWKMDLNRAFTFDFEEYQNSSIDDAEIHIYISLLS